MDFGSAGIKGDGKARAFEFPDGADAAEAIAGRARLRYNDVTGQLELSISQGPYLPFTAGGGAIPLNGISWVDGRNGNDATAIYGSQNNPFQTVQAAVNSAIASGFTELGVVVLGGDYPEDVVVPIVTTNTRLAIIGLGGVGVNIRAISATAPAAGISLDMSINTLTLGGGAGQTVAPLQANAADGGLSIETQAVSLFTSAAVPAIETTNAAATGALSLILGEGQTFVAGSPSSALEAAFGEINLRDFTLRALNASPVVITGPVNLTASDTVILAGGAAGNPVISHAGAAGQVNLISSFIVPAANTDDAIVVASPAVTCAIRSFIIGAGGYTGQIVLSGGSIFHNFIADASGQPVQIVGAGAIALLQNTSQVQNDSLTVIGGQTALEATDDLLFGTTQIGAAIVGPGVFALGDDATVLVDTGAAVTLTLPDVTTLPRGKAYRIVDVTGGGTPITINPTGADTVNGGASLAFTPGAANASIVLQSESAANNWVLTQADPTAGGGGAAIPLDRIAFVNQLNGNDGTAVFGDIALPYQTVQAAVTAAITSGSAQAGVVIGPGEYSEDVVAPVPTVDTDFSIVASAGPGSVILRGLQVIAPAGGLTFDVGIDSMVLGDESGAQGQFPLDVRGGAGDIFVRVYDSRCQTSTSFVDAYFQLASTGLLEVRTYDTDFVTTSAVLDTASMTIEGGLFHADNAEISGGGFFSVVQSFSGLVDIDLSNSTITKNFDSGIAVFDMSTSGELRIRDSRVVPVDALNRIVDNINNALSIEMTDVLIDVAAYTANFSVVAGTVVRIRGVADRDGTAPGIPNATIVPLEQAEYTRFDSPGVLGTTTVEAATEALVQGTSNIGAPLVGPGTVALGNEATVLVDTSAPITLTLPGIATRPRGNSYRIVDVTGGGNTITINPTGGDTVNGGGSLAFTPAAVNGSILLQSESASTNWALTQVDPTAGGGGGPTIPVDSLTYVNPLNGNDGTGVAGDIAFPFATIQAAVSAALATLGFGSGNLGIIISPGSYVEDVTIDFTLGSGIYLGLYGETNGVKVTSINVIGPVSGSAFEHELFIGDLCIGFPEGSVFSSQPALTVQEGTVQLNVMMNNVACFVGQGNENVILIGPASTGGVFVEATGGGAFAQDNVNTITSSALVMQTGQFRGNGFVLQGRNAPGLVMDGAATYIDDGSEIRQVDGVGSTPLISSPTGLANNITLENTRLFPAADAADLVNAAGANITTTFNDCLVTRPTFTGTVNYGPGGVVNVTSLSVLGGAPVTIAGASTLSLQHNASQVQYTSTTVLGNRDASGAITELVRGVSETPPVFLGPGTFPVGDNGVILIDTTQPITIDLPAIASVPAGRRYRFVDIVNGGSSITIAANGAETINGAATLTITSGNRAEIISYPGSTDWAVIDS